MHFDVFTHLEVMFAAFEHPDVKGRKMAGKDLTDEHIAFGFRKFFEGEEGVTDELIEAAVIFYRRDEQMMAAAQNMASAFLNSIIPSGRY